MDNNNMEDEEETSISIMTAEESALNAPSDEALRVPYYCEENVWRLLYRKKHECPDDRFWVVFISNTIKVRKCSMMRNAGHHSCSCKQSCLIVIDII